jgi:hypothetical protein
MNCTGSQYFWEEASDVISGLGYEIFVYSIRDLDRSWVQVLEMWEVNLPNFKILL